SMSLAFADRDFYYGDPAFAPTPQPMSGLLSKGYAKQRAALINPEKNNALIAPGDPYPFEGRVNPYKEQIKQWNLEIDSTGKRNFVPAHDSSVTAKAELEAYLDRLWRGTTSVEAADKEGWVVSITPSGGWLPATIAGNTGIGMSQRMQSFVLDAAINPFNVVAPGKRPRVTLTPSMALKEGKPYLSFAVQGGDTQDQNLLQFFLNMVEFGMTVQQASEAENINTNQLWLSLGGTQIKDRKPKAGNLLLSARTPEPTREALKKMGYKLSFGQRTSGPINAIFIDRKHNSLWGGSSNNGEDYGIGW
ncbi:MAG: gamma-glutamyltransferase, partial [Sphingobacteriia bacterium 32-37-4]